MAKDSLLEPYKTIFEIAFSMLVDLKDGQLTEKQIMSISEQGFNPSILRGALRVLGEKRYLYSLQRPTSVMYLGGSGGPNNVKGTETVWELAELGISYALSTGQIKGESNSIPALDRFVQIDHNSADLEKAISNLKEIENRIENSNQLTANSEERLAIIREVVNLKGILSEQLIRKASIWAATTGRGILATLATHWGDSVLSALADQTIKILFKIFGFGGG